MIQDLRRVSRPTRTKPGMKEFFILLLVYSYYNKTDNIDNEFSIPQAVLADYFSCSVITVKRWFSKLRDLGYIRYAEREDAGKVGYYKDTEGNKCSYNKPKYKRIRCGSNNEIKFLNIYVLDQQKLNQYLLDRVDIDVLSNIKDYKYTFDKFIDFLSARKKVSILALEEKDVTELSSYEKQLLARQRYIEAKIVENEYYLDIKKELDEAFPEFTCKYLEEGCLRLTNEICSTLNPEHADKISENNHWRKRDTRYNMLEELLNTDRSNIIEYDINGSIYRLTYNLNHDEILSFDTDIYELIWKNCNFNIDWPDEKYRNTFKKLIMPVYMRPHIIGYKASQYTYIDKYFAGHPIKYKRLSKDDQYLYESYNMFVKLLNIDIKEFLTRIRESLYTTLNTNKLNGSSIFIHESNLHLLIRKKLLEMNIKSVNIYDGFYMNKNVISKNVFYTIYRESIYQLKLKLRTI